MSVVVIVLAVWMWVLGFIVVVLYLRDSAPAPLRVLVAVVWPLAVTVSFMVDRVAKVIAALRSGRS